ncbi:hypothetical protein IWX90DRAFT_248886 [Phyllosticta citrichinensis]|uniref:Uncharacterized protein n=1 Tax=Phyllosticta citrichinensis TaxID=1130410 RepID=A0ABR1XQZ3_9PEZI
MTDLCRPALSEAIMETMIQNRFHELCIQLGIQSEDLAPGPSSQGGDIQPVPLSLNEEREQPPTNAASQGTGPIPLPLPTPPRSPAAREDGPGLQAPHSHQQTPAAPPGLGNNAGMYLPGALEERRIAFCAPRFQQHGLMPPPGLQENEGRYLPQLFFPGAEIPFPPPASAEHRRGPSQQELLEQERRRPMLEQRMEIELRRQETLQMGQRREQQQMPPAEEDGQALPSEFTPRPSLREQQQMPPAEEWARAGLAARTYPRAITSRPRDNERQGVRRGAEAVSSAFGTNRIGAPAGDLPGLIHPRRSAFSKYSLRVLNSRSERL